MHIKGFRGNKKKTLPPLQLHNTLSGDIEPFKPLSEKEVKMYNCGPTPYDRQHIGNLFPPVIVNVLRHTLETWGYPVKQVTNITDFGHLTSDADAGEDKMTLGLRREGLTLTMENMHLLAEKYTDIFLSDLEQLGIDITKITFPRASSYISQQIALIQTLEQKGYAYRISDGVYYDTAKFTEYGKLGGIDLSALHESARIEKNTEKKNPHDFVLWKSDATLGWTSPWGRGFPGWHIECTAMIFTLLGKQIDIHTGGIEHIPIHHNNEIAQAEAATGKQFVRYWIHNAHITVEGRKISKSLGNTIYLSNIVDRGLSAKALRYWFLTAHYRTQMNFTWDAIEGADVALRRLTLLFLEMPQGGVPDKKFMEAFYGAIAHDLDTPRALASVWEFIKDTTIAPETKRASLVEVDAILGLGFSEPAETLQIKVRTYAKLEELPSEIQVILEPLCKEREEARGARDFTKADTLRAQIEELGYLITDTPEGPQFTPH